jgi:hypothetical protein
MPPHACLLVYISYAVALTASVHVRVQVCNAAGIQQSKRRVQLIASEHSSSDSLFDANAERSAHSPDTRMRGEAVVWVNVVYVRTRG